MSAVPVPRLRGPSAEGPSRPAHRGRPSPPWHPSGALGVALAPPGPGRGPWGQPGAQPGPGPSEPLGDPSPQRGWHRAGTAWGQSCHRDRHGMGTELSPRLGWDGDRAVIQSGDGMGTEPSPRARTAWKVQQGKSPWMPEPWSREGPLSPAGAPQGPAEPRDQRPRGQSSAPPPPSCPGDKATCAQRCPGRGCGPGAAGGGSEGPLPMAGALEVSGAGGRGAGAGGAAAVSGLERLCRAQAAPGGLLSREKGGGSGAKPREGLPSAWEVPAQLCGFFPPPRRQS